MLAVGLALAIIGVPASAEPGGTTLTASMAASGHTVRTYGWSISKTASPDAWDLPLGESGVSQYTIAVERMVASEESYVDGQVCVTNDGNSPTENLQIVVLVLVEQKASSGPLQDQVSAAVDVSARPGLASGESYCYPYRASLTPVAGATHRIAAQITITPESVVVKGMG